VHWIDKTVRRWEWDLEVEETRDRKIVFFLRVTGDFGEKYRGILFSVGERRGNEKDGVVGRICSLLPNVHILIPGTCEYVTLHAKWN
jgi:hypothetical protein